MEEIALQPQSEIKRQYFFGSEGNVLRRYQLSSHGIKNQDFVARVMIHCITSNK
jgi:hypothetical protein